MKKISTKINLSILCICTLILAFVGAMLVINMSVDYYRDFGAAAERALDAAKDKSTPSEIALCLDEQLGLLQSEAKHQYYILKDGNIILSSAEGGILDSTENMRRLLQGENATLPAITSKTLDYGASFGGYTVYILASKAELYGSILDITVLFLQALALAVLLAAIISYFVSKRLTASVEVLADGAKKMAAGGFEKIRVDSRDEIGRLCELFNEMGQQIQNDFDEFERVEVSRREFVANVSHELKTPLTVIKSYSQTLSSMPVDDDTRREFLKIIDSEADRMSDIVGQLLLLSRLEHPSPLSLTDCDLYALCQSIAEAQKPQADEKSVVINIEGGGTVYSDADKIKTILTNLLTNAVKYSENGGTVTVAVTECGVRVENGGMGIAADDLEHIFERFYRTDRARNRSTGGTGLGLAIAKASADAIGAKLYAKSEPGVLTVFTLEF